MHRPVYDHPRQAVAFASISFDNDAFAGTRRNSGTNTSAFQRFRDLFHRLAPGEWDSEWLRS